MDAPDLPSAHDLLGGGAVPASAEALRQVMTRHRRWQSRALGGAVVVALVGGSLAGFAVGRSGGGAHSTSLSAGASPPAAATSQAAAPQAAAPQGGTGAPGGGVGAQTGGGTLIGPPTATQLLLRDANDGTRVRLYERAFSSPKVAQPPKGAQPLTCPGGTGADCAMPGSAPAASPCSPVGFLQAEVSNDQVAGLGGAPLFVQTAATQLSLVGDSIAGQGEPRPIAVVLVRAAPDVTQVTLTTDYGTDTASPVNGLAALAVSLPANFDGLLAWAPSPTASPQPKRGVGFPKATVTGRTAASKTVGAIDLPAPGPLPPGGCQPKPCTIKGQPVPPVAAGAPTPAGTGVATPSGTGVATSSGGSVAGGANAGGTATAPPAPTTTSSPGAGSSAAPGAPPLAPCNPPLGLPGPPSLPAPLDSSAP